MVTIRLRPMMWFVAGVTLATAMLWTSTVWRAEALPGPSESTTVNVTPERVLDSRDPVDLGLPGPFASRVPQKLQITGPIPTATGTKTVVPTGATGVLLNVTGFNPTANGFISIRPGDATGEPTTSSLNVLAGQTVPNAVQVSLPTSGANAGQIDITYDALGQTGPTTDMLIDVVAYTTNAGLQDVNTELGDRYTKSETYSQSEINDRLGQKANSADVYTKTDSDARFVPHGEIEMSHGHQFSPNFTDVPTSSGQFSDAYAVFSGDGLVNIDIEGPAKLGGVAYGLKSVSYCLLLLNNPPGYVDDLFVFSTGPSQGAGTPLQDTSDRKQDGCYTFTVNNTTATVHTIAIKLSGGPGAAGSGVGLQNVTSLWAPVSEIPRPSTTSNREAGAPPPGSFSSSVES